MIDEHKVAESKEFCVAELPPCKVRKGLSLIEEILEIQQYSIKNRLLIPKTDLTSLEIVQILSKLGLDNIEVKSSKSGDYNKIIIQ